MMLILLFSFNDRQPTTILRLIMVSTTAMDLLRTTDLFPSMAVIMDLLLITDLPHITVDPSTATIMDLLPMDLSTMIIMGLDTRSTMAPRSLPSISATTTTIIIAVPTMDGRSSMMTTITIILTITVPSTITIMMVITDSLASTASQDTARTVGRAERVVPADAEDAGDINEVCNLEHFKLSSFPCQPSVNFCSLGHPHFGFGRFVKSFPWSGGCCSSSESNTFEHLH
ncbi:hypothetical protein FRB93_003961 [Tulasnella sp. JGI-2019a]|nr:hypothetical protein FRB93_003961 [Tulasnella sp. JGI-2019a]